MARIRKKSTVPIYAVGVTWLVWGLMFPLYRPAHYIAAALVSLVVYLLGRTLIWKDRIILVPDAPKKEEPVQKPPEEPKEAAPEEPAGSPETEALLKEKRLALQEMRRLNDSIQDPELSRQIDHLEEITGKILDHVVQHPNKQPQIRRFLNYYLPTTIKLLNAYDRMDDAGVAGTNIDGTMGKIETMMETIVAAFDRQLDALFADEALDISTDITVLEQMLRSEGLSGDGLGGTRPGA